MSLRSNPLRWAGMGAAAALLLTACGTSADSTSPTPAFSTPASAQEDVYGPKTTIGETTVKNKSTSTVYVSFENCLTNYGLDSGVNVWSSFHCADSSPPQSLRITRDGGAQTLFVDISSATVDVYPAEGQPKCLETGSPTGEQIQGNCQGRQFSLEFSSVGTFAKKMVLTLTGDNWG